MYNIVSTVNNIVLHILKLLRKWIIKFLITKKILSVCMLAAGNEPYCGDHVATHTNIKSLCCTAIIPQ